MKPGNVPEYIEMWFNINGVAYAMRGGHHVPVVGDEVRFNGVNYRVVSRRWIYDHSEKIFAVLDIEAIEKGKS